MISRELSIRLSPLILSLIFFIFGFGCKQADIYINKSDLKILAPNEKLKSGINYIESKNSPLIVQQSILLKDGNVLLIGAFGETVLFDNLTRQFKLIKKNKIKSPSIRLLDGRILSVNYDDNKINVYNKQASQIIRQDSINDNISRTVFQDVVLLPNNKVLLIGGMRAQDKDKKSPARIPITKMYDPNTGSYTSVGNMVANKFDLPYHSIGLSQEQVLFLGNDSVELFSMKQNKFSLICKKQNEILSLKNVFLRKLQEDRIRIFAIENKLAVASLKLVSFKPETCSFKNLLPSNIDLKGNISSVVEMLNGNYAIITFDEEYRYINKKPEPLKLYIFNPDLGKIIYKEALEIYEPIGSSATILGDGKILFVGGEAIRTEGPEDYYQFAYIYKSK